MMPTFAEFHEAVWGYPPFPWQSRLADRVLSSGWPDVLDLPTGVGKSTALDVALFHLAVDGGRVAPRRIVLVVDRRVIVDQVGRRACLLREALGHPTKPATRAVSDALRAIVGSDCPLLETAVLRGGTLRDEAWARYPHVPVLAASTVDQVGSRLLFRGYGVSDSMRPVHAGLLGCDTLMLLDEVQLARPFADVLDQLAGLRGPEGEAPRRFQVVQLSATPGAVGEGAFRLDSSDRSSPVLVQRLDAKKPTTLREVKVGARKSDATKHAELAAQAATQAQDLVREGRRAIAVVLNRVDAARRAWRELDDPAFDRVLLTGRMRPLDQQEVLASIEDRAGANRMEDPASRPLVVVATQCIEAGADFDFDGLVTECASLDALRQRFGRLDRLGRCRDRLDGREARAVILCRSDLVGDAPDAVYGHALPRTWQWLHRTGASGPLDMGIDALAPHVESLGDRIEDLRAPSRESPVVLPAYLDQWVQTNPAPHADPDVSLFLHGIPEDAGAFAPDVRIVWRADVTEEDLERAMIDDGAHRRLIERVAATPPGAAEALSIPIWTARRWLDTRELLGPVQWQGTSRPSGGDEDVADVEGLVAPSDYENAAGDTGSAQDSHPVLVWRGRNDPKVVLATDDEFGAGDLVIVPATRGGLGPHRTFDPEVRAIADCSERIQDLGDAVQLLQRGRASLRLDPAIYGPWLGTEFASSLVDPDDTSAESIDIARDVLRKALAVDLSAVPDWFEAIRRALRDDARPRLVRLADLGDGGACWVAVGRKLAPHALRDLLRSDAAAESPAAVEVTTEGEDGSFAGVASDLESHLRGVGDLADRFAARAVLPASLRAAVRWAGWIHDAGKVDRRFQVWLHGGDEVRAAGAVVLAKSALLPQDVGARRRARERARYPQGQRHELVSLDMAECSEALRGRVEDDGADWDLVLHLVASHHGWCRPAAPPFDLADDEAEDVSWEVAGTMLFGSTAHGRGTLDSGVVDRFWDSVRRYGWHELAYLEAILRLADHRRSEQEQEGGGS